MIRGKISKDNGLRRSCNNQLEASNSMDEKICYSLDNRFNVAGEKDQREETWSQSTNACFILLCLPSPATL